MNVIKTIKQICSDIFYSLRYYLIREDLAKYHILSIEETIKKIADEKISIGRFGDGELRMILFCKGISFQQYDADLSCHLKNALQSNSPKFMPALPDSLLSLNQFINKNKRFWRNFCGKFGGGETLLKYDKIYGNAFISRIYITRKDKSQSEYLFKLLMSIWEGKDILIVEGNETKLGVGNGLFDCASSTQRILCPDVNAYSKYTEIISKIQQFAKNRLILLALGPTATVAAYDLSELGFFAVDIGHLNKEYEWFKMGAVDKVEISLPSKDALEKYYSEIVCEM